MLNLGGSYYTICLLLVFHSNFKRFYSFLEFILVLKKVLSLFLFYLFLIFYAFYVFFRGICEVVRKFEYNFNMIFSCLILFLPIYPLKNASSEAAKLNEQLFNLLAILLKYNFMLLIIANLVTTYSETIN